GAAVGRAQHVIRAVGPLLEEEVTRHKVSLARVRERNVDGAVGTGADKLAPAPAPVARAPDPSALAEHERVAGADEVDDCKWPVIRAVQPAPGPSAIGRG